MLTFNYFLACLILIVYLVISFHHLQVVLFNNFFSVFIYIYIYFPCMLLTPHFYEDWKFLYTFLCPKQDKVMQMYWFCWNPQNVKEEMVFQLRVLQLYLNNINQPPHSRYLDRRNQGMCAQCTYMFSYRMHVPISYTELKSSKFYNKIKKQK